MGFHRQRVLQNRVAKTWNSWAMRRFSQVDVFTDDFLLGNPVAVVHDADGLTDDQMATVARWTNLSETTFLLAPTVPTADFRLRIFTPRTELPFAGHPTLGSARAWLEAGGVARVDGRLIQECAAGLVRVRRSEDGRLAFAAPPLIRSGAVAEGDLKQIARALQIPVSDIVDAQWADNGPGWVAVLMRDADAVLAVDVDRTQIAQWKIGLVGASASPGIDFEIRAFMTGGDEDPVTGSLNAAVAQWLIGTGRAPTSYIAAQGARRQRRGRVRVEQIGDDIWIAGDTVVGITGEIAL
jgi:PhzF family phenazine biosynthesis protein